VTAKIEDGTVMAIEHNKIPIFGVQFHPESIATDSGHQLLKNFLNLKNK
jgi:anthranilate/para-aminobenzoate synthase component II